jgi:hypothetical protein
MSANKEVERLAQLLLKIDEDNPSAKLIDMLFDMVSFA